MTINPASLGARPIDDSESRNEPGGTAGNGFMNAYDRHQDRGHFG